MDISERANQLAEFIKSCDIDIKKSQIPKNFQDDYAFNVKVNGKMHKVFRVHDSFRECYHYSVQFGKQIEEIQGLSKSQREEYLIDLTFLALKIGE